MSSHFFPAGAGAASSWSDSSELLLDLQLRMAQEGALLSGNRWFLLLTGERSACPPGTELLLRLPYTSLLFALQNAHCIGLQRATL